jgi:pyruvate-formate lyase-activating enzyme
MYYTSLESAAKKNNIHFNTNDLFCIGTVGCNLQCKWCLNKNLVRLGEGCVHSEEKVLEDISKQNRNTVIGFCYNEPTLNPNLNFMARYALERGFKTYISTNGMYASYGMSVFDLFHYIDLDIKYPIDKSGTEKWLGIDYKEYSNRISRSISTLGPNKINITWLYIPSFWNKDDIDYIAALINRYISHGSCVSLRAFYPYEVYPELTAVDEEQLDDFYKTVRKLIKDTVWVRKDIGEYY